MILIHTIIVDKFNKMCKIGETTQLMGTRECVRAYKKERDMEMKREKFHQRREREREK